MSPQKNDERPATPCSPHIGKATSPLLIGDDLHVLNPEIYRAILAKDAKVLQGFAQKQLEAGAEALAVNLGPGREVGKQTSWVVDTLQEVADLPLFFSANILRNHDVLQKYGHRITINAISANPLELEATFESANKYGCSVVVLLVRSGTSSVSVEDKIILAGEVLAQAAASNFPQSRLYLDPVLSPHPDPISWQISRGYPDIGKAVETITLIKELDNEVKTIVALGNGSRMIQRNGYGSALLRIFEEAGVNAVLMNGIAHLAQENAEKVNTKSLRIAV